jgi:hypothetical protein
VTVLKLRVAPHSRKAKDGYMKDLLLRLRRLGYWLDTNYLAVMSIRCAFVWFSINDVYRVIGWIQAR